MNNSKTVSTPLAAHFKSLSSRNLRKIPYPNAVGSIMYAMVCFRPDVAYGVGWLVSRFLRNPGKEHWEAVKWLVRYLKGTADHGIMFGEVDNAKSKILGHVDSDFVGDLDKRIFIIGFVFTLCSGVVSWKSSL